MQREIKFRAWNGEEILNDWLVLKDTGGGVFPVSLTRKAEVVMQFTGLLDKNGKEIYEGDVVQWDGHKEDAPLQRGKVVYPGSCFYAETGKGGMTDLFSALYDGSERVLEIIGNIYENPDLLSTL